MKPLPGSLREAWAGHISAEDYERHMAAVGQAEANASLLEELFRDHAPPAGGRILFAGAGAGQCFDYFAPAVIAGYRATFTDINPAYLDRLAERLSGCDISIAVDDIEDSRLEGPFDLAIAILVLEHVDWRRAVASLARRAGRVFAVIQRNPAVLPPRPLPGTLGVLHEVRMALLDPAELTAAFAREGFRLTRTGGRDVLDGKTMLALDFSRG